MGRHVLGASASRDGGCGLLRSRGGLLRGGWLSLVAIVAGVAGFAGLLALAPSPSRAASVQNAALILGDSVQSGTAPDGSGRSLEAYEATLDGFTTTTVTGAQWDAMTAAQFAEYQVLVIGDPACSGPNAFAAAAANASTWEPVVMASQGNKVLIGTDPTFHYFYGGRPGDKLEANGIAYAGAAVGATGAYVDLTCAYAGSSPGTPVSLLDGLSSHGSGQFTVGGAPCTGSIAIVASTGPTAGLHDADLSGWQCSVHEFFDNYPSDYTPLALATDPNVPPTYSAVDVDTGGVVSGSPYILIAGSGIVVTSSITLSPHTQTLFARASAAATVTATVASGGTGEAGKAVTFTVDSGPNAGQIFTGTTDGSGQVSMTYSDFGRVGTDSISATFVDDHGAKEKDLATVTWVAVATITGTVTSTSGTGVSNVCVYPFDSATGARTADAAACTDASGHYTLRLDAAGSYDVVFYDATGAFVTQWYRAAANEGSAAPVTLAVGTVATGIDAVLASSAPTAPATAITGRVTNTSGAGIPNICVYPFEAGTGARTADPAACTDSLGNYALRLAAPGSYDVVFYDATGNFVTQWYENARFEGLATPVAVADGIATPGIDAVLARSTQIIGTVTDAAGHRVPNICVYPYDAATGNRTADPSACTDAAGSYTLSVAAPGSYNVVFYDSGGVYVTQWYRDAPYEGLATPVTVAAGGPTTGIDAVMTSTAASQIIGTVTDASGHGIANICVYPFLASTTGRTSDPAACTDASGHYALAVSGGSYNVVFYDATHTYQTQWYTGAQYEAQATPVSAAGGTPTTGIDATLTP